LLIRKVNPDRSSLLVLGALAALFVSCAHQERHDPEASAKRLAVGQDYYAKHMVPAALIEIQRALDLDPENPEAHYLMGILKMGQGVEHIELAERAACLHGAKAEAERVDATLKMHEAEGAFQRAIQYRPYYAEAFDGLAVVAIYTKNFDQAVKYEERAQENAVFAENPIARGNLGWAYYGKKDFIRAEKELREAVAKSPEFCVGRYRLGQVLFDQGEFSAAAEQLSTLSQRKCPIQEAYRVLGLAEQRLHAEASAKQAFETCIQLAPKSCLAEECRTYALLLSQGGAE
jgi:Tfp pilus assembly protein PilF